MFQAVFGIVGWSLGGWYVPAGLGVVAAGVWILCRARGTFSGRWFSPLVTIGLAGVMFALWQTDLTVPHAALRFFSPLVFFLMLLAVLTADLMELAPLFLSRTATFRRRFNWPQVAFWGVAAAFVIYMILIPTSEWLMNQMLPNPTIRELEYMSIAETVRLRSMEAFSGLWFFALGATIGSFLNVVAYRLPRGESVVFQRSRCPQCGTQILGRDNIPIFGWVMLGGRCRNCASKISARYPIVELITAVLFLVLYFVELISGGANIPVRSPNAYAGVVWILMYTKWDLVGMYLYHSFALSVLLSCVLIDIDHQEVNSRTRWFTGLMLLAPPLIWPDLMPVPFIAGGEDWLPYAWLRAGTQCLLGGLMGMALGTLAKRTIRSVGSTSQSMGQVASFLAVVGIVLGWQGVIAVTLIGLLMRIVAGIIPIWRRGSIPFTALLLVAFVTHQIIWRWTIDYGSPWWPSHLTSGVGWVGVAAAIGLLVLVNRQIPSKPDAPEVESDQSTGCSLEQASTLPRPTNCQQP
ncbi:prepilin peptidase [Bremerella sp. JC770]|uniref:prepilin peptidase n=1 Tax=Bremerella sp. JC770 TaxID=3232137 RepID=UPI00345B1AD0